MTASWSHVSTLFRPFFHPSLCHQIVVLQSYLALNVVFVSLRHFRGDVGFRLFSQLQYRAMKCCGMQVGGATLFASVL